MKKALKIILKLLAGVAGILIISYLSINFIFREAFRFNRATNLGDYPTLEEMLNEGFNPNKEKLWGRPLSIYVLASRLFDDYYPFDINVTKFLLEHGVSPNTERTDIPSILHYAILVNNIEYIKLLLDHGADINQECNNITPLDAAYKLDNIETIRLIQDNGELGSMLSSDPIFAYKVILYYIIGISNEKPLISLFKKKYYNEDELEKLFDKAEEFLKKNEIPARKGYDRKKVLTIINNYDK